MYSTNPSINARKRLLYAQNKYVSKKQIHLKYKVYLNTQTFPDIPLSNVSLPQHPEASLANPSPSKFPTPNVFALQLPPFISTSFPYTSHTPPSTHPPSPSHPNILVNLGLNHSHQWFCERMYDFSLFHIYSTCKESYPNMKTKLLHGNLCCSHFSTTKSTHHFSLVNNLDPGDKPFILASLTQKE